MFHAAQGGPQKVCKEKRHLVTRGAIEPSVYNGFSRPSGRSLQVQTWHVNRRGIGLQKRSQARWIELLFSRRQAGKTHRKTRSR